LARLFEEVVDRAPHAPAILDGGERLDYAELDRRANRLAHRLVELGVGIEEPVAVGLPRSAAWVTALLAVLKAGGAYVPLDFEAPDERLALLQRDLGLRLAITDGERLRGLPFERVRLDADAEVIARQPAGRLDDRGGPDRLAYLLYTSGSTGAPKAVAVEQRGVAALVLRQRYVSIDASQRVAHGAHPSFDAATFEVWGALLNGATLVILPTETMLDPRVLAAAIAEQGLTQLFLTTALLHHAARLVPDAFAGLAQLSFGGEAVDPRAVRAILAAGPPARLVNLYGPTETTTLATFHVIDAADAARANIPIGQPIANTQVWVVDEQRELVPIGEPGELCVGGAGVARGYVRRPAQTEERFVQDPFEPGGRLYRTGDRVRRRADGAIEFLGRFDRQVKIRGVRVEPGEIEATLRQHPSVRDAAVVATEGTERRLLAYVAGDPARARELRSFVEARLPRQLHPASWTFLDSLPLHPQGKTDLARLPAFSPPAAGDPPRGPVETAIAEVWAAVLSVKAVGRDDGFYQLGGHSLRLVELIVRLRERLGVTLALRDVLENPTVARIAERVAQGASVSAPIPRRVDRGTLPIAPSLAQRWHGHEKALEWCLVRGTVDLEALERSVQAIVDRHEVLRTRLVEVDGVKVQQFAPREAHRLVVEDLRGRRDQAHDAAHVFLGTPFELAGSPLRVGLLQLADDEQLFLLAAHHRVFDGASVGIFWHELNAGYRAFRAGGAPDLAPLPIDFADWAAWQQTLCNGPAHDREAEYWRTQLAGAASLRLPADRPRAPDAPEAPFDVRFVDGQLIAATHDAFVALARAQDVTLQVALLAAFVALLQSWSGERDLLLMAAHANRDREETVGLIGCFAMHIPVRVDCGDDPTFVELLQRVQRVWLGARANAETPGAFSQAPPGRVAFNYHPEARRELHGVRVEEWRRRRMPGKAGGVDLALLVRETPSRLVGEWRYNAEIFEDASIASLAARLDALVARALEDPTRRLSTLG
jgi:amino acid adenylation domain-containing protein